MTELFNSDPDSAMSLKAECERLTAELAAVRQCFAEASHDAGPAFVAHEALKAAQTALAASQGEVARLGKIIDGAKCLLNYTGTLSSFKVSAKSADDWFAALSTPSGAQNSGSSPCVQ